MSTGHLTRTRRAAPARLPGRVVRPANWATLAAIGVGLPWLVDGYTISLASNALILALIRATGLV